MSVNSTYFESYEIGRELTTTGRTVTEADIVTHAGQTGDFFPHHVDAEWCKTQPFQERVAHGTLIFSIGIGLTAQAINTAAMTYGYDRLRFVRPVFIGDTIRTTVKIVAKRDDPKRTTHGFVEEQCTVTNQRGEVVMSCIHILTVARADAVTCEGRIA